MKVNYPIHCILKAPLVKEFTKVLLLSKRENWTYSLAQRPALSNSNLITLLHTESWRDVRSQVLVSLLVTCVFRDKVKVFAADNQSTVHLGRNNGSSKDTATDGNQTGEGALLV